MGYTIVARAGRGADRSPGTAASRGATTPVEPRVAPMPGGVAGQRGRIEVTMLADPVLFAEYFAGVRRRTLAAARVLPVDGMDWCPRAGEFTAGDLLRHLAAAQRMYLDAFLGRGWRYPGQKR